MICRNFPSRLLVEIRDVLHICHCLRTAAIAVFHHRIVIISGIHLHQERLRHIPVPHLWVEPVFICQSYSVIYMGYAYIIGGDDKLDAFLVVRHVFPQVPVEIVDKSRRHTHACLRIVEFRHARPVSAGCARHDLHQTAGANP